MATVYEIRQLAGYFEGLASAMRLAASAALVKTVNAATTRAKRNAVSVFKGTRTRPKTGNLANAIFAGFEKASSGRLAEGFVGVRSKKGADGTRPYGRIHEYGGTILPRQAKNLWIPLFGPKSRFPGGLDFHKLTPGGFVEKMRRGDDPNVRFWIKQGARGKVAGATLRTGGRQGKTTGKAYTIPLFALRQRVEMPARPYVTPAVEAEFPSFADHMKRELARIKR